MDTGNSGNIFYSSENVRQATSRLLIALFLGAGSNPTAAVQREQSAVVEGRLVGYVFAADGSTPIPDAHIVATSAELGRSVRTVSDSDGGYGLEHLRPGHYRIDVRRIGFRPTSIILHIVDAKPVYLSIALDLHPVLLSPLAVTAENALDVIAPAERSAEARVINVASRQKRYLTPDVREITADDVAEAVTLGDGDVLRALQIVPGIATKSDWTAELWTRGGRWDQTRVYFDGVPVFNPLHTFGMFSAISAEAIERVRIHPGVKLTSLGEGAAGVVEVLSANAKEQDGFGGAISFSTFQAGATARQPLQNGNGGVAISGRMGNETLRPESPYGFVDLTGRLDLTLTEQTSLETSFLWSGDRLREYTGPSDLAARADWQNAVARTTFVAAVGNASVRQTIGFSRSSASTQRKTQAPGPGLATITTWPTDNSLHQIMIRGDVLATGDSDVSWSSGYEIRSLRTHYYGSPTAPYALQTFTDTLTYLDHAEVKSLWGEVAWKPFYRVQVETGLRIETGGSPSPPRAAPRVAVRVQPTPRFLVSAALGRSFQYAQTLAGSGAVIGPGLQVSQVWLLAGPQVPVLQADIITAGGELWLSRQYLAGVNLYRRLMSGVVIADPRSGFSTTRSLFETASNDARGVEFSLRKLAGAWSGAVSYAHGQSTMHALGVSFPSAAEREHVVNATIHTDLRRPILYGVVSMGIATRMASGAPFTRLLPCPRNCGGLSNATTSRGTSEASGPNGNAGSGSSDVTDKLPAHRASSEWAGQPNALRAPSYWNVDATFEWSRSLNAAHVTAYMQIRNIFNRANAVTYIRTGESGCADVSSTTLSSVAGDCFEAGIPFRPVFGARIRF